VLRNRGAIDPKIDDYIAHDGYVALVKALTEMTPQQIIAEIKRSGLRGRGGGGFPAGIKWETCRRAASTAASSRWSSATRTRATPARSWIAASSRAIRTPWSRG